MVKYFCNKCQKELPKGSRYQCNMRIKGFSAIRDTFDCDYCEECLADIIGKENLEELKSREAERKKRVEERKKERESNG